jgi:hypothetical protein
MGSNRKAIDLLRSAKIKVAPEIFTLVSLTHAKWRKLLEIPEASPRMTAPFMILMDPHEVTLLLDETDFAAASPTQMGSKIERGYRFLTFDIELELAVVGFMAEVSRILAEVDVPIMALSAFSRDHLLIKHKDLARALKALGSFVDDVC